MRLDLYLPFLRKATRKFTPPRPGVLRRAAGRLLPVKWLSDREAGKPGSLRRLLRWMGPTWLSSPVRRLIQGVCFALFLVLFFYVCWPYDARPAEVWKAWIPVEVDGTTGRATLARDEPLPAALVRGATVYVVEEGAAGDQPGTTATLGRFRVAERGGDQLVLTPEGAPTAAELEALSLSVGPWELHATPPGAWPAHYAENLAAKETLAAEAFLVIDPLLSLSTALAARAWVWSLACAAVILAVCVLVPRGFCGYLCPLGTLIDLFDWSIANRFRLKRVPDEGWWVHIKYYLLLGTLAAAACGVLLTGFVAAIPVITRGLLFTLAPLQTGLARGWHQVPPFHAGHIVSIVLFVAVLSLGFLKPRFWCKYVCPSGAVFSLGNLFRASERKVESTCIHCNKCVEICPFDAIKPDFTTRTTDCTLCQTCGGVCPTHAIKFVERWNTVELKLANDPPTGDTPLGRRGFLATAAGVVAGTAAGLGAAGATRAFGARLDDAEAWRPIRPPGSVPEREFLQMCIRCGECFKACPNDVLHALGFQQGLEGLWTPHVVANWAGCESSCNACGQVCPTGAIRALPLAEKKVVRMGLAVVNQATCLPFAGREACQLCVDECINAGYDAIEFTRVGTEMDEAGMPVEGTGFLAPVVLPEKCVGCGLCQTRCYGINQVEKGLLSESAIIVMAGGDREDRMMSGSYVALRDADARQRSGRDAAVPTGESYLPEFLDDAAPAP